ncbi:hypothetical protein ACWAT4_21615 [Bradyrhizobium manausense]
MSAENQGPTDDELLNEVLTDETADSQTVTEHQEQNDATSEAQTTTQEATTETATERSQVDDNAPQVPSWRVREINEEKRRVAEENERLKAEMAELRRAQQQPRQQEQPKAEKPSRPDPLLDPDGYAAAIREELRQEALAERREESLQRAAEAHPDEFQAAYTAAQKAVDPALRARMQASRDPGKTLLEWHREQKVRAEVGTDPNAWLEKKLEERLNDPTFLAKAVERARGSAQQNTQTNGRPRTDLPPSLNGASRANTTLKSSVEDDVSDSDLFQQIAG